jgi:hypothetical protein
LLCGILGAFVVESEYEYIKAVIDDGDMLIVYRLKGNMIESRTAHDEDVSDWSERDIRQCLRGLLDLERDEVKMIEVVYA